MALENEVFLQDPVSQDFYSNNSTDDSWGHSCSHGFSSSSSENVSNEELFVKAAKRELPAAPPALAGGGRRKRRRLRCMKNEQEMENQRMSHIAVERNRRKQMNDYLAVIRSLMPPSYSQRGDQATIVGGAINFVKELEHLVELFDARIQVNQQKPSDNPSGCSTLFSSSFTFPQYSTQATTRPGSGIAGDMISEEKRSTVADIEVTMVDSHANIKILSTRRPKQLLSMVTWLHTIFLTILHLNITTVGHMVLYSFSVKVEDECQLSTVNEIATAAHEMVSVIQAKTI